MPHLAADPLRDPNPPSIADLISIAWQGRMLIVRVTFVIAAVTAVISLILPEVYRANAVFMQASADAGGVDLGRQFGGLASLVGISLPTQGTPREEALAVLRSRAFTEEFITEQDLLPVLFADEWDAERKSWREPDPAEQPSLWNAYEYFDENVRRVAIDNETGLMTLSIDWTDPRLAARWANEMIVKLNRRLRDKAISESERNLAFLQKQMQQTDLIAMQQAVARAMENQVQAIMVASGRDEFAFRIVDPAMPPVERNRPQRTLMVVIGAFIGGVLSTLWVLFSHATRVQRRRDD